MSQQSLLKLKGVSENNLKGFDLSLEHNKLIAITGISGSGKSSLAFDTIYAEGGRRYIETFSPYTRQFLDRLHQPKLESIDGARPALALEQRNRVTNSRSTVGTITEINEYLKIVWAHLSVVMCPNCQAVVQEWSAQSVAELLLSSENSGLRAILLFPVSFRGESSLESFVTTLTSQGFLRYYSEDKRCIRNLEELGPEEIETQHVYVALDRVELTNSSSALRQRLSSGVKDCYHHGHGICRVLLFDDQTLSSERIFYETPRCASCGTSVPRPRPALFSFNSPLGACSACRGFGNILTVDRSLCVPDPRLSIAEGALQCWNSPSTKREFRALRQFCEAREIDLNRPWSKLSARDQNLVFEATKKKDKFLGVDAWFARLQRKSYKMHVRVFLARYRTQVPCADCRGSRLTAAAFNYLLDGLSLPAAWEMPITDLHRWFLRINERYKDDERVTVALEEVVSRLHYLVEIGLGYLTLGRQSRTLSGGENQRVNLTAILGTRLVNTMIVLDEPSVGLHPSDTGRLNYILRSLCDRGNTVLVVEHDPSIICACDEIIDLGPRAGTAGGTIVYHGPPANIASCEESITGKYLAKIRHLPSTTPHLCSGKEKHLTVKNAHAFNLKNITVSLPLNRFVVLCGVSGSGKSSFIDQCLYQPFQKLKSGTSPKQLRAITPIDSLTGTEHIADIVLIDQSPVGRSPRSNPATYTKAWDIIRDILASTPGSQKVGFSRSSFSFNTDGGRCPVCKGAGALRVEMQFLADVFVVCDSCYGTRFKEQVLEVRWNRKNVLDFLQMTLDDALAFFARHGEETESKLLIQRLQPLIDLGLGYLTLGQPLSELSGGEAQRVKLAFYLADPSQEASLFILDEPTTGLHPHDTKQLLAALRLLITKGHSVLCVEHNLDVIAASDHLIELGPGGGNSGGMLICNGLLETLIRDRSCVENSPTLRAFLDDELSVPQETEKPLFLAEKNSGRSIHIIGAREHNLKHINVEIPTNKLCVVTGVSGSGKSTLAFDILFSEGQRRYIDSLSPYARQFITQLKRPDIDRIENVPPTIAVSQKTAPPLGISTLATTTELYQFLRLLFTKVGVQHCPTHNAAISRMSSEDIADELLRQYDGERAFVFAPVISGRKGYYSELFNRALKADITEARVDDEFVSITPNLRLTRHKLHWISLQIASLSLTSKNRSLLLQALEQAVTLAGGTVEIALKRRDSAYITYSTERVCPSCKRGFRELDPQDFSFRSKRGACSRCSGTGTVSTKGKATKIILCPECNGERIGSIGRNVFIQGQSINSLTNLTAPELETFLRSAVFSDRLQPIVEPILRELIHRLKLISAIGLEYLSLNRESSSLSGGEAQRLRLARTLGSPLTGVCYILDEPTIGLHPADHAQLMLTLRAIRDGGNTVVVVEHDEETIRQADHIIDIGPGAGAQGGSVVYSGTLPGLLECGDSMTGTALQSRTTYRSRLSTVSKIASVAQNTLQVRNAHVNNLKRLNLDIPLGRLIVVAGVSGAGKSSLVRHTLIPLLEASLNSKHRDSLTTLDGVELRNGHLVQRVLEVDQTPVGRTPSSTPASYLGIFDHIRRLYAMTPEALTHGWTASHFSFNSKGGRCETCSGRGFVRVPMSFLPDAVILCEVCGGKRYSDDTLTVEFLGESIGSLLEKTIDEARLLFINHPRIYRPLDFVCSLGLGYLTLGQPTHTLSGGEAQRLKIARELGSKEATDTFYLLDEPTTGLHMSDVDKLISVLRQLVVGGNSVLVVEHNLDVICAADHLIELGPGPGERGGYIIYEGPPALLLRAPASTPTMTVLSAEYSDTSGNVVQNRRELAAEVPA